MCQSHLGFSINADGYWLAPSCTYVCARSTRANTRREGVQPSSHLIFGERHPERGSAPTHILAKTRKWVYTDRDLKYNNKDGACCYLLFFLKCLNWPFTTRNSKTALSFRRTIPLNGRAQHERGRMRARDDRQLHAAREASRTTREPVLFQNGWETNTEASHQSPVPNNLAAWPTTKVHPWLTVPIKFRRSQQTPVKQPADESFNGKVVK